MANSLLRGQIKICSVMSYFENIYISLSKYAGTITCTGLTMWQSRSMLTLLHPRRHILTGLLIVAIYLLTYISLRAPTDNTHSQETDGTHPLPQDTHPLPQYTGSTHNFQTPPDAAHHDRFLTLDFMVTLGLNNLRVVWHGCTYKRVAYGPSRYELEHHIYYAYLLNRTLVVPSHLHMRNCYQPGLCAIEGHIINDTIKDGGSINSWSMPITNFFDLAHLRKYVKVITVSEFLQLQLDRNPSLSDIPAALASYQVLDELASSGKSLERYAPDLTSQTVEMYNFLHEQPNGVLTVDDTAPIVDLFRARLPHPNASSEDVERDILELEDIVEAPIWGYIDQPSMAIDQEYDMTVRVLPPREWSSVRDTKHGWVDPDRAFVDRERQSRNPGYLHYSSPIAVTGLRQRFSTPDLHNVQILHLGGGAHRFSYHPVRFSSLEGRKLYDNVVLDWLRYAKPAWNTYEYIKAKMDWKTEGRPFLTFHIRRGDFCKFNWVGAMADPNNLIAAYERAVADLNQKYKTMVLDKWDADREDAARRLAEWESADPPIPTSSRPPAFNVPSPLPLSPYTFIATDEDDPEVLARLNAVNGITLFDLFMLVRDGDKESFHDGHYHLTVFGDLLGMVDQLICKDGWWFIGTFMSSLTGGIYNLRKGMGLDDRLTGYISDYQ
ncbi:hypothetical protein BC936DRAFT_138050 [Jimgerdemannia flammicorona]|uniref:GDP-fucose protein O-fucosyltransferase 2 n=1 Tax=Jimgerdemannia flammicorona TaxID=994334 RepID=A0A433CW80_9FUNG|nr:hypothetical protein BC936DRAFT_138050 [Jimgerdemannia flammicorona]